MIFLTGSARFQWSTGKHAHGKKSSPAAGKWGAEVEQTAESSDGREDGKDGAWAQMHDGEEGTIRPCPQEVLRARLLHVFNVRCG